MLKLLFLKSINREIMLEQGIFTSVLLLN